MLKIGNLSFCPMKLGKKRKLSSGKEKEENSKDEDKKIFIIFFSVLLVYEYLIKFNNYSG